MSYSCSTVSAGDVKLGHPGPAGVHRQLGPVLLGGQPDRGGLDPQRQVLADQHDVVALGGQAAGHRQDARVVVAEPEPGGQHRGSEWLSSTRTVPPSVADRQFRVQPAVLDAQVIEVAQGLAGEVAQFGMVPLGFQLGDDDDRQDYLVLIEAGDGRRVGEQDAGVEYVRTATLGFDHADSPGRQGRPGAGQDTDVSDGPGLAPKGRAGPSVISPARKARSIGDSRALPGTAPRRPPLPKVPANASRQKHRRGYEQRVAGYLRSRAEPAVPRRVGPQRPQEVDLAEVRPVGVAEVELRVGALPEQEAAQPLLAGGADDQIGVGLARV